MTDIDELRAAIRSIHDVEATHIKSVPVTETFNGKTLWDGTVEIFKLYDHPEAEHVYAWSHETDDPANPKRHVTVLHVGPITSPQRAVQAAIMQEIRSARVQA